MVELLSGFNWSDLWSPRTLVVGLSVAVLSGGGVLLNRVETVEQATKDSETRLEKRIDGVEERLGKRIDGIESRFEKRFDQIDARFEQVNTSLQDITQSLGELKGQVNILIQQEKR